jgi:hypothetical protein
LSLGEQAVKRRVKRTRIEGFIAGKELQAERQSIKVRRLPDIGLTLAPTVCAGGIMKERTLTVPEIALIAGTRVALGAGLGLLVSERLNKDQRKGAGWTLFGIGLASSIPIAINLLRKRPAPEKPVILAA